MTISSNFYRITNITFLVVLTFVLPQPPVISSFTTTTPTNKIHSRSISFPSSSSWQRDVTADNNKFHKRTHHHGCNARRESEEDMPTNIPDSSAFTETIWLGMDALPLSKPISSSSSSSSSQLVPTEQSASALQSNIPDSSAFTKTIWLGMDAQASSKPNSSSSPSSPMVPMEQQVSSIQTNTHDASISSPIPATMKPHPLSNPMSSSPSSSTSIVRSLKGSQHQKKPRLPQLLPPMGQFIERRRQRFQQATNSKMTTTTETGVEYQSAPLIQANTHDVTSSFVPAGMEPLSLSKPLSSSSPKVIPSPKRQPQSFQILPLQILSPLEGSINRRHRRQQTLKLLVWQRHMTYKNAMIWGIKMRCAAGGGGVAPMTAAVMRWMGLVVGDVLGFVLVNVVRMGVVYPLMGVMGSVGFVRRVMGRGGEARMPLG